jgi:hypothetical protein
MTIDTFMESIVYYLSGDTTKEELLKDLSAFMIQNNCDPAPLLEALQSLPDTHDLSDYYPNMPSSWCEGYSNDWD